MSDTPRTQLPERLPMKATRAYHLLGEVSSDVPDWCVVTEEDGDNYYGRWLTGIGLIDVRFPKETTHPLTEEDQAVFDALVPRLRVGGLGRAAQAYGNHPLPSEAPPLPVDLDAEVDRL